MSYEDVIKKLREYALQCPWCKRKCATKQSLKTHMRACPNQDEFIIFVFDFYQSFKPLLEFEKPEISAASFGLLENYILRAKKLVD